jgi:hypothetical protein
MGFLRWVLKELLREMATRFKRVGWRSLDLRCASILNSLGFGLVFSERALYKATDGKSSACQVGFCPSRTLSTLLALLSIPRENSIRQSLLRITLIKASVFHFNFHPRFFISKTSKILHQGIGKALEVVYPSVPLLSKSAFFVIVA